MWILVKVLSFGLISEFYGILKTEDQLTIAELYNLDIETLSCYLTILANYRNICAHGNRLFNAKTQDKLGYVIPVVITIYQDRSFTFILKTPPAPELIKKACGIETASAAPNKNKVAKLTKAQVEEIAKIKMVDTNAASLEACMSMIKGTARSMGVTVEE